MIKLNYFSKAIQIGTSKIGLLTEIIEFSMFILYNCRIRFRLF